MSENLTKAQNPAFFGVWDGNRGSKMPQDRRFGSAEGEDSGQFLNPTGCLTVMGRLER